MGTGPRARVAGALVALSAAHLVRPDGWIGQASYLAVTVGASAFAWFCVRRHRGASQTWLAVAISASALGDVLYDAYEATHKAAPDVSIADAPWMLSYVALGIAMLWVLRRGNNRARSDFDGLIDMAVVALVAMLVLWQFWLAPSITDSSTALIVRVVWAVYPIFDATMLALVVRLLIERRAGTAWGVLLAGGVSSWLVSDFWFLITTPGRFVSSVLDVGWMMGAALLAGACWRVPATSTALPDPTGDRRVGRARVALAVVPLLVPGIIELVSFLQGREANPVPLFIATVAFTGLAGLRALRLIRVRDRAESQLLSSERLYRSLAANSADAVLVLDRELRITNDAANLAALMGHAGDGTRGRNVYELVVDPDGTTRAILGDALASPGRGVSGEARVILADADEAWLSIRTINLLDDPDVRGVVVNLHDITARKRAEEELSHQALHDALTGLANRALFADRVQHALSRRARTGVDPAVIYLDLDGFKNVNDGLGHGAGDELLREIATRLAAIVRSGDTVARLGGDEFAILVEASPRTHSDAQAMAERALGSIAAPVSLGGHDVSLTASVGVAHADADSTASSLLRDADVAMYQAKADNGNGYRHFKSEMQEAVVKQLATAKSAAN
jgi:diguanylate cyclase (GGDEF)-like protein/PAS domain S-box-containing protein